MIRPLGSSRMTWSSRGGGLRSRKRERCMSTSLTATREGHRPIGERLRLAEAGKDRRVRIGECRVEQLVPLAALQEHLDARRLGRDPPLILKPSDDPPVAACPIAEAAEADDDGPTCKRGSET
jgi:hypothetical protein